MENNENENYEIPENENKEIKPQPIFEVKEEEPTVLTSEPEEEKEKENEASESLEQSVFDEPKEPASYSPGGVDGGYRFNREQLKQNYTEPENTVYTAPKSPKNKKPKISVATVILCVVLSLLVGAGSGAAVVTLYKGEGSTVNEITENITENKIVSTSEELGVVEAVYKTAGPSVVGIRATNNQNSFFESSGDGSGVIYSSDGYIITNYHVIAGGASTGYDGTTTYSGIAEKIDVFLYSDTDNAIEAEVVGYNSSYDIAVIKIDKKGLTPIKTGDSDKLKVGQFVVAIGNPGGLQFMSSVTYGVIGGLNRTLQIESESVGLIQTDAAINPGNSGGALVDTSGNLVGINSSKLVDTSYEGMGFAIPVNDVVDMCEKIINNENSGTPYIGIEISTAYEASTLEALGFPSGAVVSSVTSGSPADEAGLQRADIITSFNGEDVTGYEDFRKILSKCKPKDTVAVEIYRNGRTYKTTLTIGVNNQVE